MIFETAEILGAQFHLPNQTSDVTSAIEVQAVEILQRKIMRMNVDSQRESFQLLNFGALNLFLRIRGRREYTTGCLHQFIAHDKRPAHYQANVESSSTGTLPVLLNLFLTLSGRFRMSAV